jgi:nicotinamide-nucleotide amidase
MAEQNILLTNLEATLTALASELAAALKVRGLKLALAESCTGGMVAEAITRVAGSSAWFDRGFVTYSNQSKTDMLGVSPCTLEKFGAVSEQTAVEMALGALKHSQAQIAGSITGIAGPDGGSAEKPVGTVCFSWTDLNKSTSTATKHFTGNRQQIRQQAAAFLMQQLVNSLKQAN